MELELVNAELQAELDRQAEKLWKKLKWHRATQEEIQEYIELMCLEDYPSVEQVPPQICEFENAAAFFTWKMKNVAAALISLLRK